MIFKRHLTLAQKASLTSKQLKQYREWLLKQPKQVTTHNGFKIDKKKYDKYKRYLLSDKWRKIRKKALEFYGNNCCKCGNKFNLQVHHRDYKNLYKENMIDLLVLCEPCHHEEHNPGRRAAMFNN